MVEIRRGKRSPAEARDRVDAGETGGAGRLGTAHHSENRGGTAGHPGYDDPPAAAGPALPLRRPADVAPATARADACVPRGTAQAIPKRNRGPDADSRSCCAVGRCAFRRGATPADCLVPVGRGEPAQTAARVGRRRLLWPPRVSTIPRGRYESLCPGVLPLPGPPDFTRRSRRSSLRCGLS